MACTQEVNIKEGAEVYQVSASGHGWRKAETFIIGSCTHEAAITIAYELAIFFKCETRCAKVTGWPRLAARNNDNEILGNGSYCAFSNALNYLENE